MTSSINQTHPLYNLASYSWKLVRDFISGDSTVKRNNTLYLPMPAAMRDIPATPVDYARTDINTKKTEVVHGIPPNRSSSTTHSNAPWFYPRNISYESYLRRGRVPDITRYIHRGLLGIANKKSPSIELPASLDYLQENCTLKKESLDQLFSYVLEETLKTGRVGLLLDIDRENNFKILPYTAESIINWQENDYTDNLEYVVIQESVKSGDDRFSHEVTSKYTLLSREVNEEGMIYYTYSTYYEENLDTPYVSGIPTYRGTPLNELPFIFVGSTNNKPDIDEAPLVGVANICHAIYYKETDLSYSEFLTCNPTLKVIGVSPEDTPTAVGANKAIIISDPEGDADYIKTDTGGLGHTMEHIEMLKKEALDFGASILTGSKNVAETYESKRIDQEAGGASLYSAVKTAGEAVESILKLAAEWSGANPDEVVFKPNTEFVDHNISPQEISVLLNTIDTDTLSKATVIEIFRKAGMLRSGETVEEEIAHIEEENNSNQSDSQSDSQSI